MDLHPETHLISLPRAPSGHEVRDLGTPLLLRAARRECAHVGFRLPQADREALAGVMVNQVKSALGPSSFVGENPQAHP